MDLNTILIILGVLALVALIAHGIWARRREKSQYFDKANAFSREPTSPFSQPAQPILPQESLPQESLPTTAQQENVVTATPMTEQPSQSVEQIRIVLPNQTSVTSSTFSETATPHINYGEVETPNQPSSSLVQVQSTQQNTAFSAVTLPDYHEETETATPMPMQSPISQAPLIEPISTQTPTETYTYGEKQREVSSYITLYIVAPENREFHGLKLAQVLEELGFILGKGNLFHYHLHLSIDGPVLFSVANINHPGTFEPQRLAETSTIGVTLFMPLPSVGNALANLKMMIRAARTLAEQLNGFILTDEQEIFTEQAEQAYLAKLH